MRLTYPRARKREEVVWAGSEVKGHRATKGAERAGGGWRLRRLIVFGGRVAEAGTWVVPVRRWEESGGRSQHAQPGDGCGEWLGLPAWAQSPSFGPAFRPLLAPCVEPGIQRLLPLIHEASVPLLAAPWPWSSHLLLSSPVGSRGL